MDELLSLLPTLIALARTGSVSRTASDLGVPRSTVSRRLARIEAVVGYEVAERGRQRLELTAAGRALVDGAVDALARLSSVHERALAQHGVVQGTLRLATPPGVTGAFIGHFLAWLHERHPRIEVELTVTERRYFRAEEGYDIVLVVGALDASGSSAWIRRKLGSADMLAVASPKYLARAGVPSGIDGLARHVLLSFATPGSDPSWPSRDGGSVPVRPSLLCNDLSVLRETAVAGMGIALVPSYVVVGELASGALEPVLPAVVGSQVPIFALYPAERRTSPLLEAALAAVSEFASAQTPQ
ncbi:MAG: LysR family transcriptional regulator [Myxococcales bacterium]|nr:LysR family transcriptional regulator [Myxococcales bacterium]